MPSLTVVINEVATRGPGGAGKPAALDEFIELRNISVVPQLIGNWQLVACNTDGTEVLLATIDAGTVMQPKGAASGQFFLVANADGYSAATAADQTYSGVAIQDLGGVRLLNAVGLEIDSVGFSDGLECTEGAAASALTAVEGTDGKASTRDVDSTDTDVNQNDFQTLLRSPKNRFSS